MSNNNTNYTNIVKSKRSKSDQKIQIRLTKEAFQVLKSEAIKSGCSPNLVIKLWTTERIRNITEKALLRTDRLRRLQK